MGGVCDDADTFGAYYGATGIPSDWPDKLHARKLITQFADRLLGAIL